MSGDPAAEERFKEIAGAYEILSDPEKRARYDTFGNASGPGGAGFTDISDIFEMFFGGRARWVRWRRRGVAARADARAAGRTSPCACTSTFRDAAFGLRRDLELERLAVCETCLGNGAQPGTAPIACRTCDGTGEIQSARRSVFGTLMTTAPCGTCEGTGQEIPDQCETCGGAGRVARDAPRSRSTSRPACPTGWSCASAGSGHAGIAGGPSGDLFVQLQVEPPETFERRNQDLYAVLDVSITQATLGADIMVAGLDGDEKIRVEPGTASGTVVRLKGKGVPNLQRRGRGDLYVTVHVVTPTDLSREERKLLERLAELRDEPGARATERSGGPGY